MTATIFVKFVGEGLHHWPDAPAGRRSFLRHPHRHLFHIEARTVVEHDNRCVEFFDVRDRIEETWAEMAGPSRDLGSASCEAMARRIGRSLVEWSDREWFVSVSEDGECGAIVRSAPA